MKIPICLAIVLLASATASKKDEKSKSLPLDKTLDKRSLLELGYGYGVNGLDLGYLGNGNGVAGVYSSGIGLNGAAQTLNLGNSFGGFHGGYGFNSVPFARAGYGLNHIGQTRTYTQVKEVPFSVPVEKPVPYPVERTIPYPVKVPVPQPYEVVKHAPYPVKEQVQVPVHVPAPYPVERQVPVPVQVPVDRPVPYHVPVPQPYPVEKQVPVPVKVPVPQPYPVEKEVRYPVEVKVPVPQPYPVVKEVKVPVQVPVDRPYPVHVPEPYPVEKAVPVAVPYNKPVPVPVRVPVDRPYPVPVEKQVPVPVSVPVPQPYPVYKQVPVQVQRTVPYPVNVPYERPVPVPVERHVPVPVENPVPVPVSSRIVVSEPALFRESAANFAFNAPAFAENAAPLGSVSLYNGGFHSGNAFNTASFNPSYALSASSASIAGTAAPYIGHDSVFRSNADLTLNRPIASISTTIEDPAWTNFNNKALLKH